MTTRPEPSPEAQRLLEEAAADYAEHQGPETQAAVREQQGWARTHGNTAAGTDRG